MMPMIFAMFAAISIVRRVKDRTERYKWAPVTGMAVAALALLLLSTMTPAVPTWLILVYMAVMGLGMGMTMQVLMLIVQNQFGMERMGTAVASNRYFQQMGMTLGASVVGSLFVSKLTNLLSGQFAGASTGTIQATSLTPAIVHRLPIELQQVIINAYSNALTPVFLMVVPLALAGCALLCFLWEKPMKSAPKEPVLLE
jgi:MFS family permease